MPLYVSSTIMLIISRSKFYYTASVIIKPVGGRPVHSVHGTPPIGVMIPDVVYTILTS
jgi:hypothetical protein